MRKIFASLVAMLALSMLVFSPSAFAVIDISAATGGIADAQTALLALLGALIALSAAIFGVVKVYGFIRRKSGA